MYVIMYGHPHRGFRFVGPFEDHEDAINYTSHIAGACWVVTLDQPLERDNGPVTDDKC